MVVNGFKNIVLMGEHGGGQKELDEVAKKTNAKYSPQGVHVFFCGDYYAKPRTISGSGWSPTVSRPVRTAASRYIFDDVPGGDAWVPKDKMVAGDPVLPAGVRPDPNTRR